MPTGTPWWRRCGRQLVPRRQGRRCCWYHGGDWHAVSDTAIRLVKHARRQGVTGDEVPEHVLETARAEGVSGWAYQALYSLLAPAWSLQLGNTRCRGRRRYVNGQHRAQALLDAGVRRTICMEYRRQLPQ
jgi:hypothetical protein